MGYQSEERDASMGSYLSLEVKPQGSARSIIDDDTIQNSCRRSTSPVSMTLFACFVGALLFFLGASIHANDGEWGAAGFLRADKKEKYSSSGPPQELLISISNDYPAVGNLEMYSFEADVVEPYRVTYLQIATATESTSYTWTITDESGEVFFQSEGFQSEVPVVFTSAGQFYTISVQDSASPPSSTTHKVICKYVRREVRSLSYEDKEIFRNALRIFYTTPTEEGKAIYGSDFFNYRDASILHLSFRGYESFGNPCTPFHGGPGFLTGHWGMVRMTERVLQLIDPSIAMPYYDYVFDSEMYGSDFQTESAVFTDAFFGAYEQSSNSEAVPLGGFWSGLLNPRVDQDPFNRTVEAAGAAYGWVPELAADWGLHQNAHGLLTEFYNPDKSVYVSRTATACGRKIETLRLPDCDSETLVLEQDSLTDAAFYIMGYMHSNVHNLLAGPFNCSVDTAAALQPGGMLAVGKSSEEPSEFMKLAVDFISMIMVNIWESMYENANFESDTDLKCGAVTEEEIDSIDDDMVYAFLEELSIFSELETLAASNMGIAYNTIFKKTKNEVIFKAADELEDKALKRFLLKQACRSSPIPAFNTPLASTADPVFYSLHSYWMKHFARLTLERKEGFDWSWPTYESTCWGHGEWDHPGWTEAGLRADGGGSGSRLSNREIATFFNPSNPRLPYIHDNLEFSCMDS